MSTAYLPSRLPFLIRSFLLRVLITKLVVVQFRALLWSLMAETLATVYCYARCKSSYLNFFTRYNTSLELFKNLFFLRFYWLCRHCRVFSLTEKVSELINKQSLSHTLEYSLLNVSTKMLPSRMKTRSRGFSSGS
jgi:hypothetical protein